MYKKIFYSSTKHLSYTTDIYSQTVHSFQIFFGSHCFSPYSLVNFVALFLPFPLYFGLFPTSFSFAPFSSALRLLLAFSPSPWALPSPPFVSLRLPSSPFASLRLPSSPFVSLRLPSLSLRPLYVLNLFSLRPPSTFRPTIFFVYGFVYLQNSRVFLVSYFFCFTLRLFSFNRPFSRWKC